MQSKQLSDSHGIRRWAAVLLLGGCCHPFVARAALDDTDRVAVLEQKLDQSLRLIGELSARVRDLETQVAAQNSQAVTAGGPALGGAAPESQTATEQRLVAVEQTVTQIAAGAGQRAEDTGLPLHGFADVGVGNHNANFPEHKGAAVGSLDFFLTPRLGTRTRALFELNFETAEDGAIGVDLERAQIGYQFSDSATVWLGRFHTPYGYYNTAFHHGQQIATSLRRPRFLQFEDQGGILPAHTVGAWLTGSERIGDARLTYDFYVGNSQRITGRSLDMNNPGNAHGSAIVGGNVGVLLGGALDGLKLGVHAFTTRIEDQDLIPAYVTRVRSYGAYAVYDTDRWEHIAEFYVFDDENLSGPAGSHRSEAGFIQLGYRAGRSVPYARFERAALQQSDNFFAAQHSGTSYHRYALGIRFDLDLKSALKLELAQTQDSDRDFISYDEALLQYAIRF
ncbi:MAG: hypothetical protein JWM63_4350 [Gammaproteobacteria bacterium]|jgi:hypothetical protein|nr:hypothetical protein [Gammaproteobacteria bacterium]